MYYKANSNPHKTEEFIDIFEIPKHGEEGFSFEDDPWSETFIDTLTTDSPNPIIALLVPLAPLAKFQTGNFIARNDRLGFSTNERSLTALEFIGLNTEQFKIPFKIEPFRLEPAFKDYFRFKPLLANLIFKSPSHESIKLGNEFYQFHPIATRIGHSNEIVAGAIRRSSNQTLLLLPLPKAEPNKIISTVTKIVKFYRTQTQKFWDGIKQVNKEVKKPEECRKHLLVIPEQGTPTLDGEKLYFWSRTKPKYRKNLQEKHVKLLKLLKDNPYHVIDREDALQKLNCEPKQLDQIIFELRESFYTAIQNKFSRKCISTTKGSLGEIALYFQVE